MSIIDAKKRIMFVPSDDFNFLAYSLIVTLKVFGCTTKNIALRDVRKFAPISSLITLPQMKYLVFENPQSTEMKNILPKLWVQTKKKEPLYQRITYALEKQDVLMVGFDQKNQCKCVSLKRLDIADKLLESRLFDIEVGNVQLIMQMIPRVRTIKYETLMERLLPYTGTFL